MATDYRDRQVGESYKDYAARMAGMARAAEQDRDAARARVAALEAVADVAEVIAGVGAVSTGVHARLIRALVALDALTSAARPSPSTDPR